MTYFIDYYTAMLARAVKTMEQRLFSKAAVEQILKKLQNAGVNDRILTGAKWLLESPNQTVTIKAWQNKFHVSTETARQDLFKLEAEGVVVRKVNGKRFEFEINHW